MADLFATCSWMEEMGTEVLVSPSKSHRHSPRLTSQLVEALATKTNETVLSLFPHPGLQIQFSDLDWSQIQSLEAKAILGHCQ